MDPPGVETGWRHGLSMEEYAAIPAMSASGLEDLRVSPAHFLHRRRNPRPRTPAMALGSALHMALLEPLLFETRYVALGRCEALKKDGSQCTNGANRLRAFDDGLTAGWTITGPTGPLSAFCGVHDPAKDIETLSPEGVELVGQGDLDRINGMCAAVLRHPEARQWFRGKGRSEVTGVWVDEASGVPCKIRVDREIERASWIHMDLKTTSDASPDAFTRSAGRLGYHRRAAWYRRGLAALGREVTASVLVAVESEARVDYGQGPEHGCVAYLLDEGNLTACAPEIDRLLAIYAGCERDGRWPGYPEMLQPLTVKPWDLPAAPDIIDEEEVTDE